MKIYRDYLKYLIRHKWYVFKGCVKYGLVWQGIVHDLSKLMPTEFIQYAKYFASGKKTYIEYKWLDHMHRNRHHWQYWIVIDNEGNDYTLRMPDRYVKEMLCDWMAVAKEEQPKGKDIQHVVDWYKARRNVIRLHELSRRCLEVTLEKVYHNEK